MNKPWKLQVNCDILRNLVDFSAEWLYWRTPDGKILYVSPAASEITGYSIEELSAFPETCITIIHPDDLEIWVNHIHEADILGKPRPIDFRIVSKQGKTLWISHNCRPIYDKDGVFLGISGSNRDITEHKRVEEKLQYLGTHDELTGLFNRAYFEVELERLAGGRHFPVSVVMADVDGLKKVNDLHGHAAGDRMLRQAATVLLETFRAEDVVARIGGDEFAVLLPLTDRHIVAELLKRIASSQEVVNCSGSDCVVSLSLGSATVRKGESLTKAIHRADMQMYQHKFSRKQRLSIR